MPSSITGLAQQRLPERLLVLEKEQQRLLGKVASRRRDLERLAQTMREIATEIAQQFGPSVDETEALCAEIHALFDELLRPGRLSKRDRPKVVRLYRELVESGTVLPPEGAELEDDEPDEEAPSAPRPAADATSIKDMYRRMVAALHPDLVVDETAKAERTEWMKEVTIAYRDGDLARLLHLERLCGTAAQLPVGAELDRRCALLEHTNAALRTQLASLQRELRAMKRSPHAQLARSRNDAKRGRGTDPLVDLVAETADEIAVLRETRDFVRAFRDQKISLAEFLDGPRQEDEVVEIDFFAVLDQLARQAPRAQSRRRRS